jgi:hypothetical protein
MNAFRLAILAIALVSLAGCVVPFGRSTGPGDDRAPYFSNDNGNDDQCSGKTDNC